MERNTLTTIDKLQVGDRFYKANDKKKEVWEVVEHETKQTHFQTYRFWATNGKLKYPEPVKKNTVLVFLRSKEVVNVD